MEINIIIAEPWDFHSSDGDNLLRAKIIEKIGECIIVLTISDYSLSSKYLLLEKRDEYGNYNIYAIDNMEGEEIKFVMIGKIDNNDNFLE